MKNFGKFLAFAFIFTLFTNIASYSEDFFNLSPDALKLNREQSYCYTVFQSFFGPYVYKDMYPIMSSTLKKQMSNEVYMQLKDSLKQNFGNLTNPRFMQYQKVNQFDRVVYIAEGNNTLFEVIYVFTTENRATLLTEFAVRPINMQGQNQQKQ